MLPDWIPNNPAIIVFLPTLVVFILVFHFVLNKCNPSAVVIQCVGYVSIFGAVFSFVLAGVDIEMDRIARRISDETHDLENKISNLQETMHLELYICAEKAAKGQLQQTNERWKYFGEFTAKPKHEETCRLFKGLLETIIASRMQPDWPFGHIKTPSGDAESFLEALCHIARDTPNATEMFVWEVCTPDLFENSGMETFARSLDAVRKSTEKLIVKKDKYRWREPQSPIFFLWTFILGVSVSLAITKVTADVSRERAKQRIYAGGTNQAP